MTRQRLVATLSVIGLCACQSASAQSGDPPARVGRVSYLAGEVSLQPVGDTSWSNASLNYPLTTGDAMWADAGARAEVYFGAAAVHVAPQTSLAFDAIEDNLVQLRMGQGALTVRLRALESDESYEIDTPAGAVLFAGAESIPHRRNTGRTPHHGDGPQRQRRSRDRQRHVPRTGRNFSHVPRFGGTAHGTRACDCAG